MRGFSIAAAEVALCLAAFSPFLFAQETTQGTKPAGGAPPEPKAEVVEPVKPMSVPGSNVNPKTYTLGPDDVIYVRVWREPDLSGQLTVRPDGKITMPLIADVQAAGLTPDQLSAVLAKNLEAVVKAPQVMVAVQQVRSKRYYISGEINRPGAYPLATPIKVFEALTLAGGFREFANKKKITIVRGTRRFRFNWNEVVKGKNLDQNIFLESGDQVIVP